MIEMAIALVLLMAFLFLVLLAGVLAVLIWSAVEMRRDRRSALAEYQARKKDMAAKVEAIKEKMMKGSSDG